MTTQYTDAGFPAKVNSDESEHEFEQTLGVYVMGHSHPDVYLNQIIHCVRKELSTTYELLSIAAKILGYNHREFSLACTRLGLLAYSHDQLASLGNELCQGKRDYSDIIPAITKAKRLNEETLNYVSNLDAHN